MSLFRYAPNLRSPVAHSRSGRVLLDDEPHELKLWDVVRVAPEVVRAFESGPDGLEVVAIGGPKPEAGDGVMGSANWPEG